MLKQVGLPVDVVDVVDLLHQSLSSAVGQGVQLRPFVFNNMFQSAPVVANYVAGMLGSQVGTMARLGVYRGSSYHAFMLRLRVHRGHL